MEYLGQAALKGGREAQKGSSSLLCAIAARYCLLCVHALSCRGRLPFAFLPSTCAWACTLTAAAPLAQALWPVG